PRPAWGSSQLGDAVVQAPPVASTPASRASHGIRAGMQVFHNKFGEGKVLTVDGLGDDARAQVSFPRHGVKWLALSVAKLTVV
nr:DNA helicase II [Serpentinimonas sp.]